MRLDCSILLKQAHVNKYHNPDMWHDNTAAVKARGSLVKGTFTRDDLHSLFVILVRLSFLWILANRKLQIGLYTLYVYMWSICTLNLVKNYTTITIFGAVGFFVASQCVLATRTSPVSFQFSNLVPFHTLLWPSCSTVALLVQEHLHGCSVPGWTTAWLKAFHWFLGAMDELFHLGDLTASAL